MRTDLPDGTLWASEMAAHAKEEDPVARVRLYVDAFNKGDVKAMASSFASPGSILAGLAPHLWHVPTAAEDWYRDVLVAAERENATDYFVALGEPLHTVVMDERDSAGGRTTILSAPRL